MATGTQTSSQKPHQVQEVICPYCRRRFESREALTLHVVTRHTQSDFDLPAQVRSGK